jgi:hypothetical protein
MCALMLSLAGCGSKRWSQDLENETVFHSNEMEPQISKENSNLSNHA